MNMRHAVLLGVCALFAFQANAQVDPAPPKSPEAVAEEHVKFSPLRKSSELLGKSIKSNGGEEVGTIRDLIVDETTGQVAFAVIEFGPGSETGALYHLVPFPAVKEDTARQNIILSIDPKRFTKERGFDPARWPDMSDSKWGQDVYDRFGYDPYWSTTAKPIRPSGRVTGQAPNAGRTDPNGKQEAAPRKSQEDVAPRLPKPPAEGDAPGADRQPAPVRHGKLIRLSQVIGNPVANEADSEIGSLSDAVIDMDGRVVYGILSHGADDQRRLAAVPWTALEAGKEGKRYRLGVTPQVLASISFEEKNWPNMHEVFWARKLHEQFAQEPYWRVYGVPRDVDAYWSDGSAYNNRFAGNPREFAGKIVRVEEFIPGRGAARGKLLVVLGDDDKQYTVHLGPDDYLNEQKDLTLRVGDMVNINGVPGIFEGNEVVQAHRVRGRDGKVLELRDDKGKVKWTRSSIRGDQNDKNDTRFERDRNKDRGKSDRKEKDDRTRD